MDKISELKIIDGEIKLKREEASRLQEKRRLIKQECVIEATEIWEDTPVFVKQDHCYGIIKDCYDINMFRVNIIDINHNNKIVSSYKNYKSDDLAEITEGELKAYLYNKIIGICNANM